MLLPDASKEHHTTAIQKLAEVVHPCMLALIFKLMMSTYIQLHLQVSLQTGKCFYGNTQIHGTADTHALAVWLQTSLTGVCQACRELSALS